ncbi:MAG: InlB B-repeat-containing protein [Christensenellales bacterium]
MKKDKVYIGSAILIAVLLVVIILSAVIFELTKTTSVMLNAEGLTLDNVRIRNGKLLEELPVPEREGYTFIGWFSDPEYRTPFTASSVTEDGGSVNIYAKWAIQSYEIVFDARGGDEIDSVTVEYDSLLNKPEDPVRTGYSFRGWYLDENFRTEYNFLRRVKNAFTLYAKWDIKTFTITFNTNCEADIEDVIAEYNNPLSQPVNPDNEGYKLVGWYLDPEFAEIYDFTNSRVTSDMTLYAKWKPLKTNITLDYVVGTQIVQADTDDKLEIPDAPVRYGYTFNGWYTDFEYQEIYDFDKPVTQEFTLYGKWDINTYRVTFNDGADISYADTDYNTTISAPESPEKTGYTFVGWLLDGTLYDFTTPIIEEITLNALWINKVYTITFDAGEGSTDTVSIEVEYDKPIGEMPIPTRLHHDFVNWYTKPLGGGVALDSDSVYQIAEDITLYAKYKYTHYSISFDTDGGSEIAPISAEYLSPVSPDDIPADPEKRGHTFIDWYIDDEFSEIYDFNTPLTGNITLYAKYSVNDYTVYFYTDGGNLIDPVVTKYWTTIDEPEAPEKIGATFSHWEYMGEEVDFVTFLILDDTELIAIWDLIPYELFLDAIDGEVNPSKVTAYYNLPIGELPMPEKTGYTFIEWNSAPDGSGDTYDAETLFEFTDEYTIYAIWEINIYEVVFNSNGGDGVASQNIEYNSLVARPDNPTKTGYTFYCWCYDESLTEEVDFDAPVEGDMTLYARWTPNEYTLTFDPKGGIFEGEDDSKEVFYDNAVGGLPTPNKPGYDFLGWSRDISGQEPDINENTEYWAADDCTVYAVWIPIDYDIIYVLNGGENDPDNPTQYNTEMTVVIQNPSRRGYEFMGWYMDSGFNMILLSSTIIPGSVEDHTLYARWEIIEYTITYILDGGDKGDNPDGYTIEDDDIVLNDASKSGYRFTGWYIDAEFTQSLTVIDTYEVKDITLYAEYEIITYAITYELDGGENNPDNPDTYTVEDEDFTLKNATKTGYTFIGWSDDEGNEYDVFDTALAEDITLYAVFNADNYTMHFNGNGGVAESEEKTVTYDSEVGELPEATREHYEFLCWNTKKDGSGTTYTQTIIYKNDEDIIVYAQWLPIEYTISYELNGGESPVPDNPAMYTVETDTIILKNPIRTGYDFGGWYDNAEFTGAAIANITKGSFGEKMLYAQWLPIEYTISYELNGGESPVTENPATYTIETDTIIINDPAKTGYEFSGWYQNAEFTGSAVTQIVKGTYGNITLYAKWMPIVYSLTYELNDGENNPDNPATYTIETDTIILNDPAKTGYDFNGWYQNAEFTGSTVTQIVKGTYDNITLYAKWMPIVYSLTYELNDGENNPDNPATYTIETDTIILNDPAKTGYDFSGWYQNAEFTGSAVTQIVKGTYGNITLYAKWTANKYKLYLDANGGDELDPGYIEVTYDSEIGALPAVTRTGYDFVKWNTESDGSGADYDALTVYTTDGDYTVYAQWNPIAYDLTYILNDGENDPDNPATFTIETDTIILNDPAKTGYDFSGWYQNAEFTGSAVTQIVKGTYGNITLYAKWTANKYKLYLDANGGDELDPGYIEVTYDSEIGALPAVTRTGYDFVKWNTESDGSGADYDALTVYTTDGDYTVYAQWAAMSFTISYDSQGGSALLSKTVYYEQAVGVLDTPEYGGFTFLGWYSEQGGNGDEYTSGTEFAELTDITLYAYWDGTENLDYTLINDSEYEVSKGESDVTGSIYIPAYHNRKPVTRVADNAFRYCTDLDNVIFQAGSQIREIGESAFRNCLSFVIITLPDSVESIGRYAFKGCSLMSFIAPASLTEIEEGAFENCGNLTMIILNSDLEYIGIAAFANSSLITVIIPSSLIMIDHEAFYGCEALTSVGFSSLTPCELGEMVFDITSEVKLMVPESQLTAYQQAWQYYLDIIIPN